MKDAAIAKCNGIFRKDGSHNDMDAFKNKAGAAICFRDGFWTLSRHGATGPAEYIAPPTEDVTPPDGSWTAVAGRGACNVKAHSRACDPHRASAPASLPSCVRAYACWTALEWFPCGRSRAENALAWRPSDRRNAQATDKPTVPPEIVPLLDDENEEGEGVYEGVDKAATPAERPTSEEALARDMDRARPLHLMAQRDSDAQKDVVASRKHAWSQVSILDMTIGSTLIDQFNSRYIPRVMHMAFPLCVGGPDFPGKPRDRRGRPGDAPFLSLAAFTQMVACRPEAQFQWDWQLCPAVLSLNFASLVNTSASLGLKRAMRMSGADALTDKDMGETLKSLYTKLMQGEYKDSAGRRHAVAGDVSKLAYIENLTDLERALLANMHFISSRLAGTRQMRRHIGHIVFSSRIFYGCPVFMTVTPSERHSGLCIRLMRYRRSDPALLDDQAQHFRQWIGPDSPSLCPSEADVGEETVEVDLEDYAALPDYDTRRAMTARNPLCCVHAFKVMVKHELPSLYGWRMCPRCPDCAQSATPCMNVFGSNATAMGGSLGRVDAAVGAVEAQKAEGVLHLHMFLYVQMANQYDTLPELAAKLREGMLRVEAFKDYISMARCASYPYPHTVRRGEGGHRKEVARVRGRPHALASAAVGLRAPTEGRDAVRRKVDRRRRSLAEAVHGAPSALHVPREPPHPSAPQPE